MEIAQLLTGSVSTAVSSSSASGTQVKTSSAFSDCLNSVLDAASQVKSVSTATTATRTSSQTTETSTGDSSQSSAKSLKSKSSKVKSNQSVDDDVDSSDDIDETSAAVAALTPEELEALQRIAVLISDGSLDPESMSELSEDELEEVVDWVLDGADGLFAPYDSTATQQQNIQSDNENLTLFGMDDSYENLEQLESIYDRISKSSLTEKDTAAIGDLINISDLDPVEIDKISQAILELAEKYAGTDDQSAISSDDEAMSLKDMLKLVPEDELATAVEGVLEEIEPDVELPELPETVLKSLCIEVVNVNNRMLDAAELNSKLLDGLNNNADLREQILSQLSNLESGQELMDSVADEAATTSELADTLADAVLEDSAEGEIAELISADSEVTAVDSEIEDELPEAGTETTAAENTLDVLDKFLGDSEEATAKNADNGKESVNTNAQATQVKSENSQVSVTEAVVKDDVKTAEATVVTEEVTEVQPEALKDTGKDSLTGRSYNGENTAGGATSDTVVDEELSGQGENKQQSSGGSEEGLGSEDDPASILKSDYEVVEPDTKADFKTVVNESVNNTATTENPYVRYADMMENIDRLSKLMASSAEKSMKSVTMELSPPELGKMTIEVSVKDGQANAAIKVETDGAKNMLLNNVEQLKRNLEGHGIKLENFEVELNKQQQDGRGEQSAFAQAQQEEQERRFRRRQNSGKVSGVAGQSAEETLETESSETSVIREDGSVDVVA